MPVNRDVLLTGATGFLGRYLLRDLLARGRRPLRRRRGPPLRPPASPSLGRRVRPPKSGYLRHGWRRYFERRTAPFRCPPLSMSACPPLRHRQSGPEDGQGSTRIDTNRLALLAEPYLLDARVPLWDNTALTHRFPATHGRCSP